MPLNPPDITELKAIVDWVNLNGDVRELSLKFGDVELHVSRNRQTTVAPIASTTAPAAPAAGPTPAAPAAAPTSTALALAPATLAPDTAASPANLAEDEFVVASPMVGTFYEAPKPGAPAFVEVGTRVEPGTVLGIVEVMKLMNNIEATEMGTVTRILVDNNETVGFGQPLVVIKRDA